MSKRPCPEDRTPLVAVIVHVWLWNDARGYLQEFELSTEDASTLYNQLRLALDEPPES